MNGFLYFEHDELAVAVDRVTVIRTVGEEDLDMATGELRRGIPAESQSVIHLIGGGYVWLRTPFEKVLDAVRTFFSQGGEA